MSRALIAHPLVDGDPPAWASAWGDDGWGVFADFEVESVVQRMRWIPPGRFVMGAPETEAGRRENEGPQHEVTLTQGYWLADTPCTQALWQAVMDGNPSRFQSAERPVEQVSWDDCVAFLGALNERLPGLDARLPTEAEWERACRAGTETGTYAGDLQLVGARNAPLLDSIAWYGGNSGVDFDLADGHDSSDWPEKQFPHRKAGTRQVALKRPNPWGLYDMLGNVWEWCADWYGPYEAGLVEDPPGPSMGSGRVLRGGSWDSLARLLRAAARDASLPGDRLDFLGFRLARGQGEDGRSP